MKEIMQLLGKYRRHLLAVLGGAAGATAIVLTGQYISKSGGIIVIPPTIVEIFILMSLAWLMGYYIGGFLVEKTETSILLASFFTALILPLCFMKGPSDIVLAVALFTFFAIVIKYLGLLSRAEKFFRAINYLISDALGSYALGNIIMNVQIVIFKNVYFSFPWSAALVFVAIILVLLVWKKPMFIKCLIRVKE